MIATSLTGSEKPAAVTAGELNKINFPRATGEWWDTPVGQTAEIYLRAWGLTTRGRRDTGDDSYVPQMDAVLSGSGSNRSHPSNVSDVLLRHLDVDRVLMKVPNGQRRLTWWAFVECINTRHSHRALYRDGTCGEWIQGPQPSEMPQLVVGYEEDIRQTWEWEFERYPALEGEERYWIDWRIDRGRHLAKSLVGVGKILVEDLGL